MHVIYIWWVRVNTLQWSLTQPHSFEALTLKKHAYCSGSSRDVMPTLIPRSCDGSPGRISGALLHVQSFHHKNNQCQSEDRSQTIFILFRRPLSKKHLAGPNAHILNNKTVSIVTNSAVFIFFSITYSTPIQHLCSRLPVLMQHLHSELRIIIETYFLYNYVIAVLLIIRAPTHLLIY